MTASEFRQRLKPWMLPLAMVVGLLFHNAILHVAFLMPYLIFMMLLLTFCRVDFRHFKPDRLVWRMLAVQLILCALVYVALRPINETLAQGALMCVLCPTATAAPVITGMLGGSVSRLVTYSLLCNAAVAIVAPPTFSLITGTDISLAEETLTIARNVAPLILVPLGVALALHLTVPRVHAVLSKNQGASFYLWTVSLTIVVGRAVGYIMDEPADEIPLMIGLATVALATCIAQFGIGRLLGRRVGDPVAGAQGLGQKNTVLGIWMAMTFLNPLSSVAVAAYILWQNTINALQLYLRTTKSNNTHS